jgi:hypothetical protein
MNTLVTALEGSCLFGRAIPMLAHVGGKDRGEAAGRGSLLRHPRLAQALHQPVPIFEIARIGALIDILTLLAFRAAIVLPGP